MSKHVKWASIESMHNLRRGLKTYEETSDGYTLPKVSYIAKVKLHGTNAGIQIHPDGTIIAQSRQRNLRAGYNDKNGFAAWVESNKEKFVLCAKETPFVIFGEWCGAGIQKKAAITEIKRKVFVIFAVQIQVTESDGFSQNYMIINPDTIKAYVPNDVENLYVLPWFGSEIELDWNNESNLQKAADQINSMVSVIEECDPWVKENFGVEGVGEGVVMYPVIIRGESTLTKLYNRDMISTYMFKAKGEKHKIIKQKSPAQISPEVAKSIDEFVSMFLTEARLEQGIEEACNGSRELKFTGNFVKWIKEDVEKESVAELEAAGLDWKDVTKQISKIASIWYRK